MTTLQAPIQSDKLERYREDELRPCASQSRIVIDDARPVQPVLGEAGGHGLRRLLHVVREVDRLRAIELAADADRGQRA